MNERWESRVAEALHDGESTIADLARKIRLSVRTVRETMARLINNGEAEARIVPDRSGEQGRSQTLYSLARTKRKAA